MNIPPYEYFFDSYAFQFVFFFSHLHFVVIEGNGPVYIHGQQVPNGYEDQVMEGGEEFDSEEEAVRKWNSYS